MLPSEDKAYCAIGAGGGVCGGGGVRLLAFWAQSASKDFYQGWKQSSIHLLVILCTSHLTTFFFFFFNTVKTFHITKLQLSVKTLHTKITATLYILWNAPSGHAITQRRNEIRQRGATQPTHLCPQDHLVASASSAGGTDWEGGGGNDTQESSTPCTGWFLCCHMELVFAVMHLYNIFIFLLLLSILFYTLKKNLAFIDRVVHDSSKS